MVRIGLAHFKLPAQTKHLKSLLPFTMLASFTARPPRLVAARATAATTAIQQFPAIHSEMADVIGSTRPRQMARPVQFNHDKIEFLNLLCHSP